MVSFLTALDAAPELPGERLPLAAASSYLPLVQSPAFAVPPGILGDERTGLRLFIRPCYAALCQNIMRLRQDYADRRRRTGGALLSGNLGVAKSVFLAYLIKALRSLPQQPTIVYHRIAARACWIIPPRASG